MKYMGHKGKLLPVLGEILIQESRNAASIADPFCGSGAVSWYLATQTDKAIISGDLQAFAVARAASVTERTEAIDAAALLKQWSADARAVVERITCQFPNAERSVDPENVTHEDIRYVVSRSRTFCEAVLPPILDRIGSSFPMTRAYGGHYFSPLQAIELDALRQTVPQDAALKRVALGALVETAGKCAASPGHTAQPFQPTQSAAKFILEAWNRDVWAVLGQSVDSISSTFARTEGCAEAGDFKECISKLKEGDLVFADPPYSDVHYSRFYHVLETLTIGREVSVTGTGRYPPFADRPASNFSRKGQAKLAAKGLIDSCIENRTNLVLTFPHDGASNGLKTADFVALAEGSFSSVETHQVTSQFSTLGGNAGTRGGRKECIESIVCFRH
jgi:adenine-specific DNA-methyltransferase